MLKHYSLIYINNLSRKMSLSNRIYCTINYSVDSICISFSMQTKALINSFGMTTGIYRFPPTDRHCQIIFIVQQFVEGIYTGIESHSFLDEVKSCEWSSRRKYKDLFQICI